MTFQFNFYPVVCADDKKHGHGLMDRIRGAKDKVTDIRNEINKEMLQRMSENITLYWASGSPPCMKVMLALEEKGLVRYNSKLVSFAKKEHKSEEVTKLNLRGQVPTMTMKIGEADVVLNESPATVLFIEDAFHGFGTTLIPFEPSEKAKVLQRMFEAHNLHQKGIEHIVLVRLFKDKNAPSAGSYICGCDMTGADVMFFPTLAFLVRLGVQLSPRFPHLAKYYDAMTNRPSVRACWPPHWNEGPGPGIMKDV